MQVNTFVYSINELHLLSNDSSITSSEIPRARSDAQSVTGIYMHLFNIKYLKLKEKSYERDINR